MFGSKNNRSGVRCLAVGLCLVVLAVWGGGCKSKSKEEAGGLEETVAAGEAADRKSEPVVVEGQAVAGVLAEIEGEVITTSDALDALDETLEGLGKSRPAEDRFRAETEKLIGQYLRSRVAEILLLKEAQAGLGKDGEAMAKAQVKAYKQQLLRDCDNSPTRLRKKLAAEGTTLEKKLEKFRRELVVRSYLRTEFASRISVGREDILDYYERHIGEYSEPRKVELLKIQVLDYKHVEKGLSSEKVREKVRERAAKAWAALAEGEEFGVVAKAYSDTRADQGGDWGAVNPASLVDAGEREAAENLGAGEYSKVLETALGCSIVSVGKVLEARQDLLADVQGTIRDVLWNKQYNRLYSERLTELGKRSVMMTSPLAIRLTVDLAQQRYTLQ